MLYLCISVGNIEKECRRKAVSCKGELYPREREGKRVHTLLTQRVTFVLRATPVALGPRELLIKRTPGNDNCSKTHGKRDALVFTLITPVLSILP